MGAFPQPSNPFLQGMMNSAYLALAIKQSHMEQQAMALRQQEAQRRNQVDDFNMRMGLLDHGAKPTQNSPAGPELQGQLQMPGATGGPVGQTSNDLNQGQAGSYGGLAPGMQAGGGPEAAPIPVDRGQTITPPGSQQAYYVPTQQEQFLAQRPMVLQKMQDEANAAGMKKGAEASAEDPFKKAEDDRKAAAQAALETTRQAGENSRNAATNQTSRANNTATNLTSRSNNAATNATSRSNNSATNATSERNNVRNNADDNPSADPVDAEQNKMDEAQKKITQLQAGLKGENGDFVADESGKKFQLNAGTRTQFQGRIKMYQAQLAKSTGKRAQLLVLRGIPPVPATGKVATRAQVQAYAQQKGVSEDDASAEFAKSGFRVQ